MCSRGTNTSLLLVKDLSILTGYHLHTICSIPITIERTLTHELKHIPFFTILTLLNGSTAISIPSGVLRAFTDVLGGVEDFATNTGYTLSAVPVQTNRALTFIQSNIEELILWAFLDACCSIPRMALSTSNTHIFPSSMISLRTDLLAFSVEDVRIIQTIRTFRSKEEQILEGDILDEGCTRIEIEGKLATRPLS